MWIQCKNKLINTRHLAEIKITSTKMMDKTEVFELNACPARKENVSSVMYKDTSQKKVSKIFKEISEALQRGDKEYKIENHE